MEFKLCTPTERHESSDFHRRDCIWSCSTYRFSDVHANSTEGIAVHTSCRGDELRLSRQSGCVVRTRGSAEVPGSASSKRSPLSIPCDPSITRIQCSHRQPSESIVAVMWWSWVNDPTNRPNMCFERRVLKQIFLYSSCRDFNIIYKTLGSAVFQRFKFN